MTVLALLAGVDRHDISYVVIMWDLCRVFMLIVLSDKLLLTLFNVLPVSFE